MAKCEIDGRRFGDAAAQMDVELDLGDREDVLLGRGPGNRASIDAGSSVVERLNAPHPQTPTPDLPSDHKPVLPAGQAAGDSAGISCGAGAEGIGPISLPAAVTVNSCFMPSRKCGGPCGAAEAAGIRGWWSFGAEVGHLGRPLGDEAEGEVLALVDQGDRLHRRRRTGRIDPHGGRLARRREQDARGRDLLERLFFREREELVERLGDPIVLADEDDLVELRARIGEGQARARGHARGQAFEVVVLGGHVDDRASWRRQVGPTRPGRRRRSTSGRAARRSTTAVRWCDGGSCGTSWGRPAPFGRGPWTVFRPPTWRATVGSVVSHS